MLIRDIVADVIAILKHPQFCISFSPPCFPHHPLGVCGRDKSITASHDHEKWAGYLLHHALKVEGLQLFTRLRLVGSFQAIDKCLARQLGSPIKVFREVVCATVSNYGLQSRLECGCTGSIISTEADSHQSDALRIH